MDKTCGNCNWWSGVLWGYDSGECKALNSMPAHHQGYDGDNCSTIDEDASDCPCWEEKK